MQIKGFPWSVFFSFWFFAAIAQAAGPLNVLLITADDLGIQLSCYGDPIASTPNIDEFAGQSVRFQTAYVSQASCSPSRSTLFTGLYPHRNGQYGLANAGVGFRVHEHLMESLLPNVLQRAGYRTGIVGKLHVDPEKEFQFDHRYNEGFGTRDVRLQIQHAAEFIGQSEDQPWFLMFNLFDPHVARDRNPDGSRGPQYFPDQVKGLPKQVLQSGDVTPWPWQGLDNPEQRKKISGYYNCVHRIDAGTGWLMELLRERGLEEKTLVLFLGDHGPPFNRGKTSCYEPGLRVPLIVRWPGVSVPHVSKRLVGSIDVYPTILDAAGISTTQELHGRSLRSVLDPESESDWRETLVAEFHFHGALPFFPRRAITDGRYKLIHNLLAGQATAIDSVDGDRAWIWSREFHESDPARLMMSRLVNPPEWELYDLEPDPVEFHNRSGDREMQAVENRLKEELAQWERETNDPFGNPAFREEVSNRYRP